MALATRVLWETIRETGWAAIGAGWVVIGTPFVHASRQITLTNTTNALLHISLDGVNPHIILPINGYRLVDVTANKKTDDGFYVAKGTQAYVQQIGIPTSGSVYLESIYGHGE